ncbi:ASCH domain-containing protein [Longilinea arvoryzae]|uniref:ASCH domain-containing protein n=1 Tax=Longilinea arvoryzae TaxID=360412 RepID=UPI00094645F9|nr:ASCH domain-containing protein [Longilinea arvoryzae]
MKSINETSRIIQYNLWKKLKKRNFSSRPENLTSLPHGVDLVQNRAISIRQPYAEQILRGTKLFEYRSILTRVRGRVYIYASLKPARSSNKQVNNEEGILPTGVIVGTVEIVDCTRRWFGGYRWHLKNPVRLEESLKPDNHPQPVWFTPFTEP